MGFKYKENTYIGPNKILFVKRLEKTNSGWWGLFLCPYDHEDNKPHYFKALVSKVGTGKRTHCGCKNKNKLKPANALDLVGQKFGRLTVLEDDGTRYRTTYKGKEKLQIKWKCVCSCNNHNIVYVTSDRLKSGQTQSCGCLQKERASKVNSRDITNQRFGKLVALSPTGKSFSTTNGSSKIWLCQCDCGKTKEVPAIHLLSGHVQSCGCLISNGENLIRTLLVKMNINFIQQYKFEGCINPKTNAQLIFDFYLPDYNCCIEYDGIQHFKYRDTGWNTEDNFKQTKYRDSIKNKYCIKNNIHLIRIPYTDYKKINEQYLLDLLEKMSIMFGLHKKI